MSIADASDAFLNVLKKLMPPLIAPAQIGFCTPSDFNESYLLGLFVYNIQRDVKFQMKGSIPIDGNISQPPPLCVEISFVVTPYIGKKSDILDDYRLLDRVLQIFHDNAALTYNSMLQPQYVPMPRVDLLSPDMDSIGKIWNFPDTSYRTSLFYKVAPIAIPSGIQKATPRVRQSELHADER